MLSATTLIGHDGVPIAPHDLVGAWSFELGVAMPLAVTAILYWRGQRPADGVRRVMAWWLGWAATGIALLSPLAAASGVLISAHMVQHVVLIGIAAPLLAASAPGSALLRGLPDRLRRRVSPSLRIGRRVDAAHRWRRPGPRWLAYVLSFWLWHSSVLYGAAVDVAWVHALEHVTFLGTALLLWSTILGPRRVRVGHGTGVVLLFLLGIQGTLLSALMTFAPTPWYEQYAGGWGLTPLADQQLAGVVMWVPTGLITTSIGLWLFTVWLREIDDGDRRRKGAAARGSAPAAVGTFDR